MKRKHGFYLFLSALFAIGILADAITNGKVAGVGIFLLPLNVSLIYLLFIGIYYWAGGGPRLMIGVCLLPSLLFVLGIFGTIQNGFSFEAVMILATVVPGFLLFIRGVILLVRQRKLRATDDERTASETVEEQEASASVLDSEEEELGCDSLQPPPVEIPPQLDTVEAQGQRAHWAGEAKWRVGAFAWCLLEAPDLCDGKTPSRL